MDDQNIDENKKREFLKLHPKLDQLVNKLLNSNEADFLFRKTPGTKSDNDNNLS